VPAGECDGAIPRAEHWPSSISALLWARATDHERTAGRSGLLAPRDKCPGSDAQLFALASAAGAPWRTHT
jgi:hypothetical protein